MKIFNFIFLFILLSSCSSQEKTPVKDWKEVSLGLAREYSFSWGEIYPEYISSLGFNEFDAKAIKYSKDFEEVKINNALKWKNKLVKLLEKEQNPELKTDLQILLQNVELELEEVEIGKSVGVIPFFSVSEFVLDNLKKIKTQDGLKRFHAYVRGEKGQLPLVEGYMSYLQTKMQYLEDNSKKGFWPHISEVKNYLNDSDQYFKALEKVLVRWPKKKWERDLAILKFQDKGYRDFLIKHVIPFARKKSVMPKEYYAFLLKVSGILSTPTELIETGLADYKKTYKLFGELGEKIAKTNGLRSNDPVSVVKYLKQKKYHQDQKILDAYQVETQKITRIMERQKLITMKEKPHYILRMATEDEMRSMPSPHFVSTPLLSKEKTPSEFIIPRIEGERGIDDFTFKEAIFNLVSHEAIPGHALQYQIMKERGTTLIRAFFAFNSANVEGWAHYAEEIISPYTDIETQFIILQRKLWRQARMFLDPQLNLGMISSKRIHQVFVKELGFSPSWSKVEFDRYQQVMPGQAPSYYYGYKMITETKTKVKEKSGPTFSELCFNDALLDLGVIPLSEVYTRLGENLKCPGP